MIDAQIYKNSDGDVFSFEIQNHGEPVVCSAVSALALNVINSINSLTSFTTEDFHYEYEADGYLYFEAYSHQNTTKDKNVALLLNSFWLGIAGIYQSYPDEINLTVID